MTLTQRMREFEAKCIREYLAASGDSSTKAAKLAGRSRTTFIAAMRRHGIVTSLNPLLRKADGNDEWRRLGA